MEIQYIYQLDTFDYNKYFDVRCLSGGQHTYIDEMCELYNFYESHTVLMDGEEEYWKDVLYDMIMLMCKDHFPEKLI